MFDHKPPAIYAVFAGAIAALGATPAAVFALAVAAFVLTLAGVAVAARRFGGPQAVVPAAAVWTVLGTDPLMQANQPNAEAFMNACTVWALACLPRLEGGGSRAARVLVPGVLFFLASAFKMVVVLVPAALAGASLLHALAVGGTGRRTRRLFVDWSLIAAVGVAGWIGIGLAFAATGTFAAFWDTVIVYNREYAGDLLFNLFVGSRIATHGWDVWPVWAAALLFGAVHAIRARQPGHLLMAAAYAGMLLTVAAPGRFFAHYYQLLLPLVALSAGWLVAGIGPAQARAGALVAGLAFSIAALPLLGWDRLALVKYEAEGARFIEARAVGRHVEATRDGPAVLYHWGAEPGVYFWSGRPSPVGFVVHYPLVEGARAGDYTRRVLERLRCLAPEVIAASRTAMETPGHPIPAWIGSAYAPDTGAPRFEHFTLWSRREGTAPDC